MYVRTCVQNFVVNGPCVYSKNIKNTNGPNFADPYMAAISLYFKVYDLCIKICKCCLCLNITLVLLMAYIPE